jgi:hypothetical protein
LWLQLHARLSHHANLAHAFLAALQRLSHPPIIQVQTELEKFICIVDGGKTGVWGLTGRACFVEGGSGSGLPWNLGLFASTTVLSSVEHHRGLD